MRIKKLFVIVLMTFCLWGPSGTGQDVLAKESMTKKEVVQYATGPGGETNPELLEKRSIKVKKPDSDGVAAVKTAGAFVIDFVTLPIQIVKVLWESVTE